MPSVLQPFQQEQINHVRITNTIWETPLERAAREARSIANERTWLDFYHELQNVNIDNTPYDSTISASTVSNVTISGTWDDYELVDWTCPISHTTNITMYTVKINVTDIIDKRVGDKAIQQDIRDYLMNTYWFNFNNTFNIYYNIHDNYYISLRLNEKEYNRYQSIQKQIKTKNKSAWSERPKKFSNVIVY